MIIIVDSIDRVGKTTLCNLLAEKLDAKIYKHSSKRGYSVMTDSNETNAMLAMIDLYKLYPDNKIIFDRFHLSNLIYGHINRQYNLNSAEENFFTIDKELANLDDVYLIKVNPTDLSRSSKEHGSDLSKHYDMFNKYFKLSNIPNKIECDYNSINKIVENF